VSRGIESELDSRARVAKLKSFISLTRGDGGNRSRSLRLKLGGFSFKSRIIYEPRIPEPRVRAFESPQGYQLIFAENCAIVELLKQIGGIK